MHKAIETRFDIESARLVVTARKPASILDPRSLLPLVPDGPIAITLVPSRSVVTRGPVVPAVTVVVPAPAVPAVVVASPRRASVTLTAIVAPVVAPVIVAAVVATGRRTVATVTAAVVVTRTVVAIVPRRGRTTVVAIATTTTTLLHVMSRDVVLWRVNTHTDNLELDLNAVDVDALELPYGVLGLVHRRELEDAEDDQRRDLASEARTHPVPGL